MLSVVGGYFLTLLLLGCTAGLIFFPFLFSGTGHPMNSLLRMNVVETWFVDVCCCLGSMQVYIILFLALAHQIVSIAVENVTLWW